MRLYKVKYLVKINNRVLRCKSVVKAINEAHIIIVLKQEFNIFKNDQIKLSKVKKLCVYTDIIK